MDSLSLVIMMNGRGKLACMALIPFTHLFVAFGHFAVNVNNVYVSSERNPEARSAVLSCEIL